MKKRIMVMVVPLVLLAGACGDDGDSAADEPEETTTSTSEAPDTTEPDEKTTTTSTEPAPTPEDYRQRGPYPVGRTELSLGDRPVIVFYPADGTALVDAEPYPGYSTETAFPESIQPVAPEPFRLPVGLDDVFTDRVASPEGPFPLVIFSHGDNDAPLYHSVLGAHVASWGFVVAAPEHLERGFGAFFLPGSVPERPGYGVDDVRRTLDLLTAETEDQTSLLSGRVDTETVALWGFSQGGRTVVRPDLHGIASAIVLYAPSPLDHDLQEIDLSERPEAEQLVAVEEHLSRFPAPVGVSTLMIGGDGDLAVPPPWQDEVHDWLAPTVRRAIIADGGHGFGSDLCAPIQDIGGLEQFAAEIPLTPEQLARLEDGCTTEDLDAELGYELAGHLTVAFLLDSFGTAEAAEASLSAEFLDETFGDALGGYESGRAGGI